MLTNPFCNLAEVSTSKDLKQVLDAPSMQKFPAVSLYVLKVNSMKLEEDLQNDKLEKKALVKIMQKHDSDFADLQTANDSLKRIVKCFCHLHIWSETKDQKRY